MATNNLASTPADFPPLPSTWDVVQSNERTIKSTPITLDSDSDSDSEQWETLEYDSPPVPYRDVAISGSVHAELQKASEAFDSSPRLSTSSPSTSDKNAKGRVNTNKASKLLLQGPDFTASDDEYEAYKTNRARAISKSYHANIRTARVQTKVTSVSDIESYREGHVPVWERLKDPAKSDRRKQFELSKQQRKILDGERPLDKYGRRKGGGFRNDGKTSGLVW